MIFWSIILRIWLHNENRWFIIPRLFSNDSNHNPLNFQVGAEIIKNSTSNFDYVFLKTRVLGTFNFESL